MNRKLLNGFLVVAVAAVGVGTFTSCKDDDFRSNTLLTETSLQAQIDAIRGVSNEQFQIDLEKWLNDWTANIQGSGFEDYADMVQAATAMDKVYQEIMSGNISPETEPYITHLYNWMFENIIQKSDWYQLIQQLAEHLEKVDMRASSVEISEVSNPVFGSVNLPLDIKSTILATYVYGGPTYTFPNQFSSHVNGSSPAGATLASNIATIIDGLKPEGSVELKTGLFTDAKDFGNMGGAVVTINPGANDYTSEDYTVELVNSKGEVAFTNDENAEKVGQLTVTEYDDVIYFGGSRADETPGAPGVYALNINATEDSYDQFRIDFEDKAALKDAVKNVWHEKGLSSVAELSKVIYDNINDKLPAYAVKVSWNEGDEENPAMNCVYSSFDLAAAVVHPLSYGTELSAVIPGDKHLPVVHNTLKEYLQKLQNKLHIDFQIDMIGEVSVDFQVKVDNGYVYFQVYDKDGNLVDADPIKIEYDENGIDVSDYNLNALLDAVLQAMSMEEESSLNNKMIADLNESLTKINDEIAKLNDRANDYLDRLMKDNKLRYAQKLVDIYNRIANKANDFLDNPNHYLQIVMGYYQEEDGVHFMSNDIKMPKTFYAKNGDVDLLATSYNGDIAVPSFKKYIAITGVVEGNTISESGLAALNSAAGLNKVFSGHEVKVKMNVAGLVGKTVRLTYLSVDYRGECSMEHYYVTVK